MNTITIKKLELFNFKGIRNLIIDFKKTTDISGKNETGKTTIFDAFTWVLFGKDSSDKSQFDIKTLDENNVVIPKIEHSVTVTLDVNGTKVVLNRLYKEDWVKKKGALESTLEGHKTLYKWNNVPKLANEYSSKISDLIDEGIFRLITNPLYFNSLHWEKRRSIVIMVAGDIPNIEIAAGNEEFLKLITGLGDKKIKEYKSELAADRKMLNDDLKLIPTRIDEATRSMPDTSDFKAVKAEIIVLDKKISTIDGAISNKSEALGLAQQEHLKKQTAIFLKSGDVKKIEFNSQNVLDDQERNKNSKLVKLESDRDALNSSFLSLVDKKVDISNEKDELQKEVDSLREDYGKVNAEKFIWDENKSVCYACNKEVDDLESKKSEFQYNFNKNQSERLDGINKKGIKLTESTVNLSIKLTELNTEEDSFTKKINNLVGEIEVEKLVIENYKKPDLQVYLKDQIEYQKLIKELAKLEAEIGDAPTVDTTELLTKKLPIQDKIDTLKRILNDETTIIKAKERIKELENQESNLSQQIADLEKSEFTIENFEKEKAYKLESKINAKFKYAKFKLFEQQINGGQIPCCETIYKGVPYPSLNNAATINIGIDIINTLCEFHDVSAPIFTDNAEAVNELMPTESQMIRLVVTTGKELKIS